MYWPLGVQYLAQDMQLSSAPGEQGFEPATFQSLVDLQLVSFSKSINFSDGNGCLYVKKRQILGKMSNSQIIFTCSNLSSSHIKEAISSAFLSKSHRNVCHLNKSELVILTWDIFIRQGKSWPVLDITHSCTFSNTAITLVAAEPPCSRVNTLCGVLRTYLWQWFFRDCKGQVKTSRKGFCPVEPVWVFSGTKL